MTEHDARTLAARLYARIPGHYSAFRFLEEKIQCLQHVRHCLRDLLQARCK